MTYNNVSAGDPILASTINDLIRYGPAKPICMLQNGTATQSIPAVTETLLTFGAGSENYDDLNWHDTVTNPSRITPTIAGRYRVVVKFVASSNKVVYAGHTSVYKNGTQVDQSGNPHYTSATVTDTSTTVPGVITSSVMIPEFTTYVDCNGTTDYIEAYIYLNLLNGGSQNSANTASGKTSFIVELERAP